MSERDESNYIVRKYNTPLFTMAKVIGIVSGALTVFSFIVNLMINTAVERLRSEMLANYPNASQVVLRVEYEARRQDTDRQLNVLAGELSAQRAMWESISSKLSEKVK